MFEPALVDFTNQTFQDKEEVIRYIAEMVWENKKIEDKQAYINAVLKREQTASTEMGDQIAIPHGESDTVRECFVAVLKLAKPVVWDQNEVALVFNIGISKRKKSKEHIEILARLCTNLMVEEDREKLYDAKNREELCDVLKSMGGV